MGSGSSKSKERSKETTIDVDYKQKQDSDDISGCCISVKKIASRARFGCCKTQSSIDIVVTGENTKNKIIIHKP